MAGSADSRLASALPADPPPMMMKSYCCAATSCYIPSLGVRRAIVLAPIATRGESEAGCQVREASLDAAAQRGALGASEQRQLSAVTGEPRPGIGSNLVIQALLIPNGHAGCFSRARPAAGCGPPRAGRLRPSRGSGIQGGWSCTQPCLGPG